MMKLGVNPHAGQCSRAYYRRFVKFMEAIEGHCSWSWEEATRISGKDPGLNRRDLYEAIEAGKLAEW